MIPITCKDIFASWNLEAPPGVFVAASPRPSGRPSTTPTPFSRTFPIASQLFSIVVSPSPVLFFCATIGLCQPSHLPPSMLSFVVR